MKIKPSNFGRFFVIGRELGWDPEKWQWTVKSLVGPSGITPKLNDIIDEMKYKVLGCAAAIATASMTSVMATGRSVSEALELTEAEIAEALGGLPPDKMHCSNLAVGALKAALRVYLSRLEQAAEENS